MTPSLKAAAERALSDLRVLEAAAQELMVIVERNQSQMRDIQLGLQFAVEALSSALRAEAEEGELMPEGQTEWERRSAHERGTCYPDCEYKTTHNAEWRRLAHQGTRPLLFLVGVGCVAALLAIFKIFGGP